MAKFKRFDPRNKKASSRDSKFSVSSINQKRSRIIASYVNEESHKRKYNDKALYTREEEIEI
jgi:hypothetical protein